MRVSTFMSKAFEECHIIQPQNLTYIHAVWQNGEFMCGIFEEKVIFSKRRGVKEVEALPLSSLLAKQHLNNNKDSLKSLLMGQKEDLRTCSVETKCE